MGPSRVHPDSDEEDLARKFGSATGGFVRSLYNAIPAMPRSPLRTPPGGRRSPQASPSPGSASPARSPSPAASASTALLSTRPSLAYRPRSSCPSPSSYGTFTPSSRQLIDIEESSEGPYEDRPPLQPRENTPLSPTMTDKSNGNANANAKAKAAVGSTADIDSMMPLLFAAHPGLIPAYKRMAELDPHGRTYSQMEHKFRKWRKDGEQILAEHPEIAEALKAGGEAPKKRAPKGANGKGKGKQTEVGEKDGHEEGSSDVAVKKGANGDAKGSKAAGSSSDSNSNKRPSPQDSEADNEVTPAKKTKVTKKRATKVVKKPAVKGRETETSDNMDASANEVQAEEFKAKGKRGAKAATPTKKVTAKAATEQVLPDIEEAEDMKEEEDKMTEMQFEEEV